MFTLARDRKARTHDTKWVLMDMLLTGNRSVGEEKGGKEGRKEARKEGRERGRGREGRRDKLVEECFICALNSEWRGFRIGKLIHIAQLLRPVTRLLHCHDPVQLLQTL